MFDILAAFLSFDLAFPFPCQLAGWVSFTIPDYPWRSCFSGDVAAGVMLHQPYLHILTAAHIEAVSFFGVQDVGE